MKPTEELENMDVKELEIEEDKAWKYFKKVQAIKDHKEITD